MNREITNIAGTDDSWPGELISAERALVVCLLQTSEALADISIQHLQEELELTHTDATFLKMLRDEVSGLHSFCCHGDDSESYPEGTNQNLPMSARLTERKVEEFGLLMDTVEMALSEPYLFPTEPETKDAVAEIIFSVRKAADEFWIVAERC